MTNLPFGENYKMHEKKLKGYFEKSPTFMKAELNGAFWLKYEDVEFDNFGKSEITFKYIQNKLMSAEVELEFFKERFFEIKGIQTSFEKEVNIECRAYQDKEVLGSISNALAKISSCREKGKGDYSQNATLYSKGWYLDRPIKKDSKSIFTGISINSNGFTGCRALMRFEFSRLDLSLFEMSTNNGMYMGTDEYSKKQIKLKEINGVYNLPVKINNNLTLDFVLDLGASDVSISSDVLSVLIKSGSIDQSDYIGENDYKLADGTVVKSNVINLRSLKIGEFEIKNVRASVSKSIDSPLLLGQSALKKLGKYQIDNEKLLLIIDR